VGHLGGGFAVDSAPGKGTELRVTLPLAAAAVQPARLPA
jgi:signal transduction histidine kinase